MTQKSGIEQIWSLRLAEVAEALRGNNFKVDILENLEEAVAFFKDELLPFLNPETVGVAGSETVTHSGVYQVLQESSGITFLNPYEKGLEPDERGKILRAIFSADLLITSTNALTRGGHLLNLDGLGNRVSAMIFGPAKVLLLVGRNKICEDFDAAVARITELSAPANNIRLARANPCIRTGYCVDCKSSQRICNAWALIEKSNPPERIHILLINEDLGF